MSMTLTSQRARCVPVYLLMFFATLINFMTQAAPIGEKASGDKVESGPWSITVQGGIAGAILIVLGLLLCFFGIRFFRVTMFLIGFYFFANIAYIALANGGVTSNTLLLVISLAVGIAGGLLLVCCSRIGVAILGGLALYAFGLWLLSWKADGIITSKTGRAIFLGVLAVIGLIAGFFYEFETVVAGTAIVGAYSTVIGIDFYAQTGFLEKANSFINSKGSIEASVGEMSGAEYGILSAFIVLVVFGAFVQWKIFGHHKFAPQPRLASASDQQAALNEKPSRFGIFKRK